MDQEVKPSTYDYIHIEKRRKDWSGLGNGKMIKTAREQDRDGCGRNNLLKALKEVRPSCTVEHKVHGLGPYCQA